MIEVVQEFVVKPDHRGKFELAFGPGGAWSKFVSRAAGFRGTSLLRDENDTRRYLVIEYWESEALREEALAESRAEFNDLAAHFGDWADSKNVLGVFRVLAEGTVRPKGKARRRR